jgi:hypothetical protein
MLLIVLGCADPEQVPAVPTAPGTEDTGEPVPQVLSASCTLTDNALRVLCEATLDLPGEATLVLEAEGAQTRTFVSEPALEPELLGWGLLPETTYRWTIGPLSGELTTGSLPEALAQAEIVTTGHAFGFDAVLHPMACPDEDYFVMLDGQGRIVWYEPSSVYFQGSMNGYEWNQDARTVLSVNTSTLLEQHVSGEVVLQLTSGVDFEHTLHHDTERWGDYRYLLFEYPLPQGPGWGRPADGVHVFEGSTWLGTFRVADHFVPEDGWGDWTHANGLQVTEAGELVLSLLNYDTVLSIDGDPASPTFLEVNWHAVGSPDGLPGPDYAPVEGLDEGFSRQHNASRHGDTLWLFDNRSQRESRAIRLRMDEAQGTLTLDAAWSFDETCENQGGSVPLPGGVLATCANNGQVWAFLEGQPSPTWTLQADCGDAAGLPLTRAIPVFIR